MASKYCLVYIDVKVRLRRCLYLGKEVARLPRVQRVIFALTSSNPRRPCLSWDCLLFPAFFFRTAPLSRGYSSGLRCDFWVCIISVLPAVSIHRVRQHRALLIAVVPGVANLWSCFNVPASGFGWGCVYGSPAMACVPEGTQAIAGLPQNTSPNFPPNPDAGMNAGIEAGPQIQPPQGLPQ